MLLITIVTVMLCCFTDKSFYSLQIVFFFFLSLAFAICWVAIKQSLAPSVILSPSQVSCLSAFVASWFMILIYFFFSTLFFSHIDIFLTLKEKPKISNVYRRILIMIHQITIDENIVCEVNNGNRPRYKLLQMWVI